jgi:hypothetical protein
MTPEAPRRETAPRRQTGHGLTSTGVRKAGSKSTRSRSREFALQALYQHLVGRNPASDIDAFTRDLAGFSKCDTAHYDALLHGCIEQAAQLDALILPLLDRKMDEISPIERGHDVDWRLRIPALHGRALARGAQRMHRTGQGIWRHRRAQVCQCGAQQAGPSAAAGRGGQ